MNKKIVATDKAPAAIGPYSQGITLGNLVFTAGQVGILPGSKDFAGADVASQTRRALQNVQAVLEAAGSCLHHVVKTTVFLLDMKEFSQMNEVYAQFFKENPPVRSTVQVAALPLGARVEIEAIAEACDCHTPQPGCGECEPAKE